MAAKFLPYSQLALAMAIVGSAVVVGKVLVAVLPVMVISCLRFAIASMILIIVAYQSKLFTQRPTRGEFFMLFFQAITGVFLFSVFLFYGLQKTSALDAGLITGTLPAVTALLAMIVLRDKLNRYQLAGIFCAVIGAILLNIDNLHAPDHNSSMLGIILIFLAVICEALFTVMGKGITRRFNPMEITTAMSVLGFILFLPFALWQGSQADFSHLTLLHWGLIFYLGLIVTIGAFWLYYAGLTHVSAATAGGFMAVMPLSTVVLSVVSLHEPLHWIHVVAGGLVLVGIFLTTHIRAQN